MTIHVTFFLNICRHIALVSSLCILWQEKTYPSLLTEHRFLFLCCLTFGDHRSSILHSFRECPLGSFFRQMYQIHPLICTSAYSTGENPADMLRPWVESTQIPPRLTTPRQRFHGWCGWGRGECHFWWENFKRSDHRTPGVGCCPYKDHHSSHHTLPGDPIKTQIKEVITLQVDIHESAHHHSLWSQSGWPWTLCFGALGGDDLT